MGQFEQYQRNKKMDDSIVQNGQRYTQEEFYQYGNMEEGFLQEHIDGYAYKEQRERGLGDNPEAPELAAENIRMNLQLRMQQTSFKERTDYYFADSKYMEAKAQRYRALADDKNGELKAFAAKHKYGKVDAKKRKKAALKAAENFEKAKKLEEKHEKDKTKKGYKPPSPLQEYKYRNEVMRIRMEGMIAAAKVKATSEKNENYRIAKAKLSCLTVLYDQAKHLHQGKSKDFDKIEMGLLKEMAAAEKDLRKYGAVAKWEEKLGINDPAYLAKKKEELSKESGRKDLTEEDVRLHLQCRALTGESYDPKLRNLLKEANEKNYFGTTDSDRADMLISVTNVVYKDQQGKPINKVEQKKQEWNQKWFDALRDPERETESKMMVLEAYRRNETLPVPTPQEFKEKGSIGVFKENPAAFIEFRKVNVSIGNLDKSPKYKETIHNYTDADLVFHWRNEMSTYLNFHFSKCVTGDHALDGSSYMVLQDHVPKLKDLDKDEQEETEELLEKHVNSYEYSYNKYIEQKKIRDEIYEKQNRKRVPKDYQAMKKEAAGRGITVFDENAYEKYKILQQSGQVAEHPEYRYIYDAAYKKLGPSFDISRICSMLLHPAHFDKDWNPISKEDQEAHLWNLKVMRHIQRLVVGPPLTVGDMEMLETGSEAQKQGLLNDMQNAKDESKQLLTDMLTQEFRTCFSDDYLKLPTPEQLKEGLVEGKDCPYLDGLWENMDRFMDLQLRMLGAQPISNAGIPGDKMLKSMPLEDAYSYAFTNMGSIMDFYTQKKYGVKIQVGGSTSEVADMSNYPPEMFEGLIESTYRPAYEKYQQVKNAQNAG